MPARLVASNSCVPPTLKRWPQSDQAMLVSSLAEFIPVLEKQERKKVVTLQSPEYDAYYDDSRRASSRQLLLREKQYEQEMMVSLQTRAVFMLLMRACTSEKAPDGGGARAAASGGPAGALS